MRRIAIEDPYPLKQDQHSLEQDLNSCIFMKDMHFDF